MKKGFAHLLLLLVILTLAAIVGYVLISRGIIKNPLTQTPSKEIPNNEQNINLKSEYENPFAKDTHYVNPFSDYKNPIDNIK